MIILRVNLFERRYIMNKINKQNSKQSNNRNQNMPVNNDQLGENASEEYKSEEYSNALNSKNNNKGFK
jgi:hypothetical protein